MRSPWQPSPRQASPRQASPWQAAPWLPWPGRIDHEPAKEQAARQLAATVKDGDRVGIGSGSSAYLALWAIARRVSEERLDVRVATSSLETEIAATTLGLPLVPVGQGELSWMVDGADEVDGEGRFLKGRGGALFREKLLWASCPRRYVVIDASKHVTRLGSRFPVPIEVHPGAVEHVVAFLRSTPCPDAWLRTDTGKDGPVITETGFLILDARFDEIPVGLHQAIKALPGVLETGIFEGYDAELIESET